MLVALAFIMAVGSPSAQAAGESRTFYLDHASAKGFPELLAELIERQSPLVEPIRAHWGELRGSLEADPQQNAVKAGGSPQALDALAEVIKVLDVPLPQITVKYQRLRATNPEDLLGAPVAPLPAPRDDEAPEARLAVGDWGPRIAELVQAGRAKVLQDGRVSTMDGYWATVYLGDPEAPRPTFLLHARAVLMQDKGIWLALAYGVLVRKGEEAKPPEGQLELVKRGEVCVNCGPGVGEMLLQPELQLSARLDPGQSLLIGGLQWHLASGTLRAPADEFVLVTAQPEGLP